jgi:hypothetical protein
LTHLNPFITSETVLLLAILVGTKVEMMGAISLMAFPNNHLSHQNKVLVPSPISVTTVIEKKAFKSALAWKGKED